MYAGDLGRFGKTHSGEQLNKFYQCEYASIHPHICRVCIVGELTMHLQMHTREKSHKCDQCAFASSQAGHFRIHFKTHTVEKENICSQCDHACSSNLRTHIKMHNGKKSHKCKQCGFAFTGAGSFYGNI